MAITLRSHNNFTWRIHPPNHHLQFSSLNLLSLNNSKKHFFSQSIKSSYNQDARSDSRNWAQPLFKFVETNFLPTALVSGVALGLVNPTLGCVAQKYSISKFTTFGIFLISGLTLRTEEIGAAVEAWPTGLLGLVSILFVTPFLSRLILQLRLAPQEFVTGLAIFSCMPTTLSSGVALTQLVGGNTALALAMTVISNLLGIFVVPFSLSKFIANGVGVSVPIEQLLKSLVITLLVPLLVGKVIRDCFGGVGEYVDQNRKLFSKISAILLSLVPWMQVSSSRSLLLMVKPAMFFVAVGMGFLLHLILLAINTFAVHSFSVAFGSKTPVFSKKKNSRAIVIVASQVKGKMTPPPTHIHLPEKI
ncbi:putative sodium/metabolite cotransporter bass4 [Ranunculus cassubicifolius]